LIPTAENVKVWKKKVDDKCGLVLSAQKQKNSWYIDSGCSKHMTGDKRKFLTAYEMIINKDKSITREASFKVDKNTDSYLDDIEAKLVRGLKKGSGKY
jgi:hypothetical protein